MTVRTVRRVLQVHTRYRQSGGEEEVLDGEREALLEAGIEVEQVLFSNADLEEHRSPVGDIKVAAAAIWSRSARRQVQAAIRRHTPDVLHVHNTFAAASPAVFGAAEDLGVAVVHTLHNYRMVCPAATAFRDGHPCLDCVGRPPLPGVLHACVRGSHSQSAVAAATLSVHRLLGTFQRVIDAYIALTPFQRDVMVRGGLPAKRIHLLPNFVSRNGMPWSVEKRAGVLYVGRLAEEKGVRNLLKAAGLVPGQVTIAGGGPLEPLVFQAAAEGSVTYLGPLSRQAVHERLRRSVALLVPSVWFEGFPMTVVEAYAAGTPVIGSRIGSLENVIADGVTGLLVPPGDENALARQIRWALDHPGEMEGLGRGARKAYEEQYTPEAHLEGLLQVYEHALERRIRLRG